MDITTLKLGIDSRDVKTARKELDGMQRSAKGAETATLGVGKALATIATSAALYKITMGLTDAVNRASDLQEAMSKFDTVFSYHADQAREWSDTLVKSYGQSRRESVEYLSSIQDLLVPMGMASTAAADLSFEVVKLATDLGSFNNQMTSKVMEDYQSALVGNYETMKKYGVVLNETVVKNRILASGVAKTKAEITASQKAWAAHQIIVESSSAAVGDFIRTSDGYANTTKTLTARWEDLSAAIGEKFLPAATDAKAALSDILSEMTKIIKAMDDPALQLEKRSKKNFLERWFGGDDVIVPFSQVAGGQDFGDVLVYKMIEEADLEYSEKMKANSLKRIEAIKNEATERDILADAARKAAKEIAEKDREMTEAFEKTMSDLEHANELSKAIRNDNLLDQLDEMRSAIDPAYSAAMDLDSALAALMRLAESGLISEDEFNRLAAGFIRISEAAGGVGSELYNNASAMMEGLQVSQRMFDQQSREFKAIEIAIQTANVARAVAAVLNQAAGGDPYTAFARMATMVSAVASLGVSLSGSSIGSNENPNQYAAGTGTLMGSSESSRSTSNVLELLKDIHAYEYSKLSGIYSEIRDLNENITGLVKGLIQYGGDFSDFENIQGTTRGYRNRDDFVKFMNITDPVFSTTALVIDKIFGTDLGGKLRDLTGKIFGGKTEISQIGAGISIGGSSFGEILAGASAGVGQFFYDMKKVTDGGWFHSDKKTYWTIFEELDEGTNRLLTQVFTGFGNTMLEVATGLGVDITDALMGYQIDIGKIDLMGKSGEEMSEALTNALSAFGDQMAEDLFGGIVSQYQKINEGLLETAVRLVAEREHIERLLEITNQSTGTSIESAIALSQSLIQLAGDIDTLTDAASTYYKAFFDDAEIAIDQQNMLSEALGTMGYQLPGTRMGFRSLVEALDLTTTAGQGAYVTLLQLSESADEYYSYLEELQQESIDDLKDRVNDWASMLDSVRGALATWTDVTADATILSINEIIERTRRGVVTSSDELSKTLSVATGLTASTYSTGLSFDLDRAKLRASLIELESATENQLSHDELSLSLMEQQATSLDDLVALSAETNAILSGTNPNASSGSPLTIGPSNDSVVAELIALREIVAEQAAQNRLLVKRISDTVDDWDGGGLPEARTS